jgi:hypothetical protein
MGKIPSSGVTMGRRPKPILEEGRRRVRRLPANRRPSHKVTLGLAEGAISRSPTEPSQAFKVQRIADLCMADIRDVLRRYDGIPRTAKLRRQPTPITLSLRLPEPADTGGLAFGDTLICAASLG